MGYEYPCTYSEVSSAMVLTPNPRESYESMRMFLLRNKKSNSHRFA